MMSSISNARTSDAYGQNVQPLRTYQRANGFSISADFDRQHLHDLVWVGGTAVDISDVEHAGGIRSATLPERDAILLRLPLVEAAFRDSSSTERQRADCELIADKALLLDLSGGPRIWLSESSRWLHVGFDRSFLETVAARAAGHHAGVMDRLRGACGKTIADGIVRELGISLAMLIGCTEPSTSFTRKQILAALASYLLFTYGGLEPVAVVARGGLAPWQLRKSKEKMRAQLSEPLNLEQIAKDCGLSLSHFSRAFRCSVGMPPHAWRVRQRVKHAQALMQRPGKTLVEIAIECGFADQSHFTRVFSRETGASPGNWRRNSVQHRFAT